MVSKNIVKLLDILPNEELTEIQQHIVELKTKRKEEEAKEYLDKLKNLLDKAHENDIHFCIEYGDNYLILCSNDIRVD